MEELYLSQLCRILQSTEALYAMLCKPLHTLHKLRILLERQRHCLDCIVELESRHRHVEESEDCWRPFSKAPAYSFGSVVSKVKSDCIIQEGISLQ